MSLEDTAREILGSAFPGVSIARGYSVQVAAPDDIFDQYDQMQMLRGGQFPAKAGFWPSRPWRPGDAKLRFRTVSGFTDRKRGKVVIAPGETVVTMVHEMLHASANTTFPDQLGADVDEGTTALFAGLAAMKAGRGSDDSYPAQQEIASALVKLAGQRTLEDAYFRGNIAQLGATVDDVIGASAFDTMIDRLRSCEGIDFAMQRIIGKSSQGSWTDLKIRVIQDYLDGFWFISAEEWERIRLVIYSASRTELQQLRDAIGPQVGDKLSDLADRGRLRRWLANGGAPDA